jgi:hypothetical protein
MIVSSVLIALSALHAQAGTINGLIQTASGGPVRNGTLTLTLNQVANIPGTAQVVAQQVQCFTDNFGNLVGEPDLTVAPSATPNLASGTLPAGTYFVKTAIQDTTGVSNVSPESSFTLSSQGTLIVTAPTTQPAIATGYRIYIGTASGNETLQGTVTGTPGTWANFSQAAALAAGSAMPVANTSVCTFAFTDSMNPTTTYYTVNLVNQAGSKIAGYPISQVRFYGGTNGSVNVSNGWPVSIGGVIYPTPIVSTPAANSTQSIAGGLSLGIFPFTAGNGTFSGNVSVANTGVFTDTQMNLSYTASVNSLNFLTEFQAAEGNHTATAAQAGGVLIPNTSTVHEADGGSGFTQNNSTSTNAVGLRGQSRCLLNNTHCWGGDFVSMDAGTVTSGMVLYGLEIDTDPLGPTSAYSSVLGVASIMGGGSGPSGNYGAAFIAQSTSPQKWAQGFATSSGQAVTAVSVGASCASGTCGSQPITVNSFNANVPESASISTDAPGNWLLTPQAGQTVQFPDAGFSYQSEPTSGRNRNGANDYIETLSGTSVLRYQLSQLTVRAGVPLCWGSSSVASQDVGISRDGAGVFDLGACSQGDTSGKLQVAGVISKGTTFTASGCTNSTLVGGATAGSFKVGQNTACSITITMGSSSTAPNGWTCSASDETGVPAVAIRQSGHSTTSCTLSMTVATNDVIVFKAEGW